MTTSKLAELLLYFRARISHFGKRFGGLDFGKYSSFV